MAADLKALLDAAAICREICKLTGIKEEAFLATKKLAKTA